jgi:hypothetical protein
MQEIPRCNRESIQRIVNDVKIHMIFNLINSNLASIQLLIIVSIDNKPNQNQKNSEEKSKAPKKYTRFQRRSSRKNT